MADYNIYIHAFTGSNSPTTPTQLRTDIDESSGGSGENGGKAFGLIRKAASFLRNPDSLISATQSAASGTLGTIIGVGLVAFGFKAAINIADKVITTYHSFADPNTGDYKFSIDYANVKTTINNFLHPFSALISQQQNYYEIKRENKRNEQAELLLGGTIYNSRYGRYL